MVETKNRYKRCCNLKSVKIGKTLNEMNVLLMCQSSNKRSVCVWMNKRVGWHI